MKKLSGKKIVVSETELEELINNAIKKYLGVQRKVSSGRIEGEIPDISEWAKTVSYSNDEFVKSSGQDMNEGLIRTYDVNHTKKIICRKFNLNDNQFCVQKRNDNGTDVNIVFILLDKGIDKQTIGEIKHLMGVCGYFECYPQTNRNGVITLVFEPHFTKDISLEIKKKYKFLYHATQTIYLQKIEKKGLIPKSNNLLFLYPSRIYCMRGNNLTKEQIHTLKSVQAKRGEQRHFDDNSYTILKINVSALPENISFFMDPMAPNAILTHDNIPPQYLEIFGELI